MSHSKISCAEILAAYNQGAMCQDTYPKVSDINSNPKIVDFIHDYSTDNIAVVKLFIRDPYYTNIKRDRAMTFISFLGNAGGLVGLCVGASFVSVFEILYHLCNCCGNRK